MCLNGTDIICEDQSTIDQVLSEATLNVWPINSFVDFSNYTHPIQYFIDETMFWNPLPTFEK